MKDKTCWICGSDKVVGKIIEEKGGQFVGWLCQQHADRAMDISTESEYNGV